MTPKKNAERRNLVPPDLEALLVAVKRELLRAVDHAESACAVLKSHTLWERADGKGVCDFDGDDWPCSTISAFAFVYDVPCRDPWERPSASRETQQ